jgi:hypothetical protein
MAKEPKGHIISRDAFFAMLKGTVTRSGFRSAINRGTVVVTDGGMFNVDHPVNQAYLQKAVLKASGEKQPVVKKKPKAGPPAKKKREPTKKQATKKPRTKIATRKEPEPPRLTAAEKKAQAESDALDLKLKRQAAQKRELELEKQMLERDLLQIKQQKLTGELIPTELVHAVFRTHFESITKSMFQVHQQLVQDLVIQWEGDQGDLPGIRKKIMKSINHAVDRADEMTIRELSNIVKEYSEKRGRGERAA